MATTCTISFDARFDSPPDQVWRVVADTNRIDAAAGLPAVTYEDVPQPDGTTRRLASYRKLGMRFAYEELPFTWVHGREFEVVRRFTSGPFRTFRHHCVLRPLNGAGGAGGAGGVDGADGSGAGCVATTTFEFEPANAFWRLVGPIAVRRDAVRPFARLFRDADAALRAASPGADGDADPLGQELPVALPTGPPATPAEAARIRALAAKLSPGARPALVERLVDRLVTAPAGELRRLRPYRCAREWGADRGETLDLFLAATVAGLLVLRWDMICPHCRGDRENLRRLAEVRERAFCPSCNVDFDVDLDRGLEVVFAPHPQVRATPKEHFCLGGPGLTPHVVYQRLLAPEAVDAPALALPPGRYRLRFTGEPRWRWLTAEEGAAAPVEGPRFVLRADGIDGADARIPARRATAVHVENRSGRRAVARVESVGWARDVLAAGELLANQRFRRLFTAEVLAPGVKLAVERVTVVFTDLVGSTAMYERVGDATAFRLVWSHLEVLERLVERHRGALVKTIGDGAMAVFPRASDALACVVEMHRAVEALAGEGAAERLGLKIGAHEGPCIAVTLDERLDYFGRTVNLAARLNGESRGGDVVLSRELARTTDGAAPLRAAGFALAPAETRLRGIPEPVAVFRAARG